MEKRLAGVLLPLLAAFAMTVAAIEEPAYDVLQVADSEGIEIRHYGPRILAATTMTESSNSGFRVLAGYIFGGNAREEKIAMTAPVQQTMPGADTAEMAFVVPAAYTMDELPQPDDERVRFIEAPAYDAAVIRFSGRATDARVDEHWQRLRDYLLGQQIAVLGQPTLNQYNPPWTLPFLRRNEIIVPVVWPSEALMSSAASSDTETRAAP